MYNYNSHKYQPQAIHESVSRLYTMHQSRYMDVQTYFDRLDSQVYVIGTFIEWAAENLSLSVGVLEEILGVGVGGDTSTATKDQEEKAKQIVRDLYLGFLAAMNSDMMIYGGLKIKLDNNAAKVNQEWPQTLQEAIALMISSKSSDSGRIPALLEDEGIRYAMDVQEEDSAQTGKCGVIYVINRFKR